MKRFVKLTLVMVTIAAAFAASVRADDNAGNYATWSNGDNLGTGFAPWGLSTTGTDVGNFGGFFLGDSTALGAPGANINSPSPSQSWAMFGTGTAQANAARSFSSALSAEQTFSIDLAVNFRNGNKGIDLRDGSNVTIFNFNIGANDYVVNNAATGNGTIGNTYDQNTAFHIVFNQLTLTGGTWTITRTGGVSDLDSGTYTGDAASFKLYIFGTDGGGANANNLYANNLVITAVPEPSTIALVGVGLLGAWFVRRRKA